MGRKVSQKKNSVVLSYCSDGYQERNTDSNCNTAPVDEIWQELFEL